jgi:FO synthase
VPQQIARGVVHSCDKPELRYRTAREELAKLGHEKNDAVHNLRSQEPRAWFMTETVCSRISIPGLLGATDICRIAPGVDLRKGIMLESAADRFVHSAVGFFRQYRLRPTRSPPHVSRPTALSRRTGVLFFFPFTTGVFCIGIGETTRSERIEAVARDCAISNDRNGHIQEIHQSEFPAEALTRYKNTHRR